MDHTDERRVKGKRVLESKGQKDVILALPLLQFFEIFGKGGVGVHPHDLDVPLVERVVDQLHLVGAGFE